MPDTAIMEAPQTEAAVQSEAAAMISMIERAAANPQVDPEKLIRLYDLHERMQAGSAKKAFFAAMSQMQPELPVIEHTKRISYFSKKLNKQIEKSSYTPYEDIDEQIRPIYTKYGFSLSFEIDQTQERPIITCIVMHEAGHFTRTSIQLPADMSGEKNAVQGVGSTITYGKRYSACAALNITTRGANGETEDDDGEKAVYVATPYEARQQGYFESVCNDLREYAGTRSEAKEWYERTKQHNKEYQKMPPFWRKIFFNEIFLPFAENLPEVAE